MSAIRHLRDGAGATRTLVFFPHAGGSANFYRTIVAARDDVGVLAVQYPGRADRLAEPCHDDLTTLAEDLAEDLAGEMTASPGSRFTFVGHSMGAIVAFEAARRLAAPVTLVASAARAPHDPRHVVDRDVPWDEDRALHALVASGQVSAELVADRRFREMVLGYVRADFEMLQRYEYVAGRVFDGAVLAVTGADDPDVTAEDAKRWQELTTGAFRHEELPGGHFYLVPDPPVDLFLDAFDAPRGVAEQERSG